MFTVTGLFAAACIASAAEEIEKAIMSSFVPSVIVCIVIAVTTPVSEVLIAVDVVLIVSFKAGTSVATTVLLASVEL